MVSYRAANRIFRRAVRGTRSGRKYIGAAAGAAAGSYAAKKYVSKKRKATYTATSASKKKKFTKKQSPQGPLVPFRTQRPRAINAWPKGLSHSFEKKVKKAMSINDLWGKYVYISDCQYRQLVPESYNVGYNDENGQPMEFFTPQRLMDAQSIMWNNKLMGENWNITTDDFATDTKIQVVNSFVKFYFKSTSSHVVNIEFYECRPKVGASQHPYDLIFKSYNCFIDDQRQSGGANIEILPSMIGTVASDWISLYEQYYVKKHIVKLLPGQSTALTFQGPRNRTVDLSKCENNSALNRFENKSGSIFTFYRVLNDISVSKNTGNVVSWNSNTQGGVAGRCTVTHVLRPPPSLPVSAFGRGNTLKIGFWNKVVAEEDDDQQVAELGPEIVLNYDM